MVARFSCTPDAQAPELPLRRLSNTQYLNTVRDIVLRSGLTSTQAASALRAVASAFSHYPDDRLVGAPADTHGGFSRLDQALQQNHVDATYEIAVGLGAELSSTAVRRRALLGACATNASTADDAQCLRDFVVRFGTLVERRPIPDEEVDFYTAVAGATPVDPPALADVIGLLLNAPRLSYLFEEGDPAAAGPSTLDAYALASRLSYLFWQTMPDAELYAAAASGELLTETGYRAQVERLYADARTDASIESFFFEWFRLEDLTPLNTLVGTPVYDAFAGSDSPSETLHQEMIAEIGALVRWVARHGGTIADVMTNRDVFTQSDALAKIYQEPKWDGHSAPRPFSNPARAGLLTRAALVASGSAASRPVVKGVRVRNALMCQPLPPPPPTVMAVPIEVRPDQTTRETVEAITQAPGTNCRGCHLPLVNPAGFATENFDALGRHRTTQRLFGEDGAVVGERPIDTQTIPNIAGKTSTIAGAGELTELIVQGDFQTCFALRYFRWSLQRIEDTSKDGCLLRDLQDLALSGRPLSELMMAVALAPQFKLRDLR